MWPMVVSKATMGYGTESGIGVVARSTFLWISDGIARRECGQAGQGPGSGGCGIAYAPTSGRRRRRRDPKENAVLPLSRRAGEGDDRQA